jgi:hypothetical protein
MDGTALLFGGVRERRPVPRKRAPGAEVVRGVRHRVFETPKGIAYAVGISPLLQPPL